MQTVAGSVPAGAERGSDVFITAVSVPSQPRRRERFRHPTANPGGVTARGDSTRKKKDLANTCVEWMVCSTFFTYN